MFSQLTKELILAAINEDLGSGDITTDAIVPKGLTAAAEIIAKEKLIVCGHKVAHFVINHIDSAITYDIKQSDGSEADQGTVIAELIGNFQSILKAERIVLNFLQRLSGISTITSKLVGIAKKENIQILDTRKTTPGWRELEKYAVKVGGGVNHRIGLFDQVLIKNNHIDAISGDVAKAISLARDKYQDKYKIEIEVRNLIELEQALSTNPDIILLDNFTPQQIKEALERFQVKIKSKAIKLEVSGGINQQNIGEYCISGVDFISLGMLTHSVKSVDLSLRYKK